MYKIWIGIKRRCNNKNDFSFKWYGGRGIKICDEWEDYSNFREWSYKNGYTDTLTIDRINPDGNYEPDNCRWATIQQQQNNRRNNVNYEYRGETHTISEWAKKYNMPYSRLYMRLYNGLSIEEALNYNNSN